jgi:hypothetical protein
MSLNPAAMAVVGIGYGPLLTAYAGLWPIEVAEIPDHGPGGDDVYDTPFKAFLKRIKSRNFALEDEQDMEDIGAMFLAMKGRQ